MKPEQLEIARLKREVTKLKAERDILKKSRGLRREGVDVKFGSIAKHRGIWPAVTFKGRCPLLLEAFPRSISLRASGVTRHRSSIIIHWMPSRILLRAHRVL
jgi:hypothetical protein